MKAHTWVVYSACVGNGFGSRSSRVLHAAGYDDLKPSHVGLFRYPTLDRQRPSELADQLQITREWVNELLGRSRAARLRSRESDPANKHARTGFASPHQGVVWKERSTAKLELPS